MKTSKADLIKQAYEHVWTDFEKFVRMCAQEHTIANMGFELADHMLGYGSERPENIVAAAYNSLYQSSESDEMAEGIEDEFRSWLKDARKDGLRVQKSGLPLTLANARLAFENKGPFAKKPRKVR